MGEQLELEFNAPSTELPQLWTPDDIFASLSAEVIRQFKEDGRVERKSQIQPKELGDYLSMYANTQPHGGVILIGVRNGGAVAGCKSLPIEQVNKLETVRRFCPDARHEFKRIPIANEFSEQDFILAVRIFYRPEKLVETADGEAYVRSGDEKRRLTESEKREIRINKGEVEYELEDVNLAWPDKFNINLAKQLASSYIEKRNLSANFKIEDVLCLLHLGRKTADSFRPNLACALVLANDPRLVVPGARLRISRYSGTEEAFGKSMNKVYDLIVDGPLPMQIVQAEQSLVSQIKNFTRLGTDGRFYTRPEYPHEVWLEAIVNALVHRSYNHKYMNAFVKMFDDKLVVESPGGFLAPVTAETIYGAHNPRNPYTMEALFYLEFTHCAYEGTRRMKSSMEEAHLPPPLFAQKEVGSHQVHVTLRNNIEHRRNFLSPNAAKLIGTALYASLEEVEKLCINYVADKGKISVSEAGRLINKDWHGAKGVLEKLIEIGIFELRFKTGKDRESSKRYVLKDK